MKHLVLFLGLLFVDDMPPVSPPTPPATPAPVIPPTPTPPPPTEEPETEAQIKAREVFVNEVKFCSEWLANLTNCKFYLKWNEEKFSKLNDKEKTIFFMQEAAQLEARARKVSRSLEEVIKLTSLNGNKKIMKEATKLHEEVSRVREELAIKREEMVIAAIRQYPDIANGLKLQMKVIEQYYENNKESQ